MWKQTDDALSFELAELRGQLWAVPEHSVCSYRVRSLEHVPSSTKLGVDTSAMGGLTLFRALARNAYLTELRATPADVTTDGDTAWVTWQPTLAHQAGVRVGYTPVEPNIVDLTIEVVGHAYYPDYEILFSHYTAPNFAAGCWVRTGEPHGGGAERIVPEDAPAYHGMYNFFPRDERTANLLTDGRGQRGRWYWRTAIGRRYALPLVFADSDAATQVAMGLPEDVSAVGLTYRGDDENDGVAGHHSMYLSLFGRDLHPGEAGRTKVRYVATPVSDGSDHPNFYEEFASSCADLQRSFQIVP